jgi:glycosyltransferase involved in cell wall biosynthesis
VRRVLFLAYHFPPTGGAGVQRSVKFVRYLRELGWESVVVTGPGTTGSRWTPADETLAAEVPTSTTVLRIPSQPPKPSRMRRRADRWLGTTTPFGRWWIEGAVEIGRRQEVDLVYGSMSPYETAEAAARLSAALDRPWVADLRDPWALDEMIVYPSRLHRALELKRMRRLLSGADALIMNTPEAAARLRNFREFGQREINVIPNGFDANDFSGPPPGRSDRAFRIVHAGYLHTELGKRERSSRLLRRALGGALFDVDILTRSHVFLLEAIDALKARHDGKHSEVELHLAGVVSDVDREVVGGRPYVHVHGYLDHAGTVALLRSADLLFLPMHDLPPGVRAGIVPGKTYDYLGARRPILAAVPDGDLRDLLTRAGNALVSRPSDVAAMARIVSEQVARKHAGLSPAEPSEDVLKAYERKSLTRQLAEIFDELSSPGASLPQAVSPRD